MYTVMIVDDEPTIREGLRTLVDWASFGFAVTATAVNGSDALQQCEQHMPDVMIVDIRMPRMSGLDLIERIRGQNRHVRFLILSGYADFDYARKAIQYKTDGYLLKPVDEDELAEYLRKLKTMLDRERKSAAAAANRTAEQWTRAVLLEGDAAKQRLLAEQASATGFDWPSGEAVLLRPRSAEPLSPARWSALTGQLDACMGEGGHGFVVRQDPHLLVIYSGNEGRREAWYRRLASAFRAEGLPFVALSGGRVTGLAQLPAVWNHMATQMARYGFFLGTERIHTDASIRAHMAELARHEAVACNGEAIAPVTAEQLYLAADVGHEPSLREAVQAAGAGMVRAGLDEEGVKAGFARLVSVVFHKFVRHDPTLREEVEALSARLPDIHREIRYDAYLERLIELLADLSARSAFRANTEKRIRRMIAFIHRNHAEPLKLETLAGLFNYNSAYLGKLFKKTTGEYFNTYLDRVRIDQAKRLLKEGEKVYHVAEKVGYANVDYFYGKFRKYVGMAPTDYRKSTGSS